MEGRNNEYGYRYYMIQMLMNANKADNSYKHDSDDHNDDEDKDNE